MSIDNKKWLRSAATATVLLGSVAVVRGCAVRVPKGIEPVENFDAERYMGKWFELARIDHRFEKGLIHTSAQYSLNPDGSITVVNRGYDPKKRIWKRSEGKGKFLGDSTVAALKVSFFRPFYGGYNVVYLDSDYQLALVVGDDRKYFWILSRTSTVRVDVFERLMKKAAELGINVNDVIQVEQSGD